MEFNLFSSIMVILYAETCNQTHTIDVKYHWFLLNEISKIREIVN